MRNPLRIRFIRHTALTTGTQVIQAGSAMAAGIIVARILGPSASGTLSVLTALAGMAVLLGSLGVHLSGVYFLGRVTALGHASTSPGAAIVDQPDGAEELRTDHVSNLEAQRHTIISNNIMFAIAGGLLTGLGLAGASLIFRRQLLSKIDLVTLLLFLPFVPLNYFNNFARCIALGMGRVRMFNLPELITGAGLFIGTTTAILVFGRHLLPLVILRVLLETLVFVVLFTRLWGLVRHRLRPSLSVLHSQIRYGLRNYASSLLWLFLLQSDLILCNDYLGSRPTGVYSIAVSLGLPITLLASVVGTLVFQRVSADHDRRSRIDNTNRVVRLLVPLIGSAVVFIAIISRWLIPIAYGQQFDGAVAALAILMPGLFVLGLETVLMNFLAGEGSPAIVYRAPFIGLLLNIVVNLFIIPRWGINGAAATSSVSYLVVFLLVLTYYVQTTGTRPNQILLLKASDVRAVWNASAAEPHDGASGVTVR